ncbi:MAG: PspC domain-containing protein [Calditrichaceae bacterium]
MEKLYRSKKDRKIAGICGGLETLMGVDSTIIRLLAILIGIVTGIFPVLITYIIGWIIIPESPES